jgi:hypothetical protein
MSPSSSPVRRRRPRGQPRPSRGRNRPSRRGAISTVVRSVLIVAAVSSVAIGTYFAFTDGVFTRLIGRQQNTDHIAELRAQIDRIESSKFLDQLTALEQRQATLEQRTSAFTARDLFANLERIARPEATPAEKPTPASPINDTALFFAPPEREVRLQSPELPASAKIKHQRRTARAPLRHRVAPAGATPAQQSPQLTSATTKPDASVAHHRASLRHRVARIAPAGATPAGQAPAKLNPTQ